MATTLKNFVSNTAALGSGFAANGVAFAYDYATATAQSAALNVTILDRIQVDLSKAGYAKNGCVVLTLSGTTPVTVDLTNLAAQTVYAGDTTFATWNELIFNNLDGQDLTVTPGASNPATLPLTGTTPGMVVYANGKVRWHAPLGKTVDSAHKTFTVTPAAGGVLAVCVGGA